MSRSAFVTFALISVLAFAACGTLEIGIERTVSPMPTDTLTVTPALTVLQATPTRAEGTATRVPTQTMTVPPPSSMTPPPPSSMTPPPPSSMTPPPPATATKTRVVPPTATATATPETTGWVTYSSPRFAVELRYPADWQPAPGEETRHQGSDGFFVLDAIGSPTATVDDVAAGQAAHRLMPYGSQPTIEALEVDGQEARLILPSADATMRGQAMLIVRYPQPIQLGDTVQFFALYADQDHIGAIAQTVRFH